MEKNVNLIDITAHPVCDVLPLLLKDNTTGKNIIWATDSYSGYGKGFRDRQQLDAGNLLAHPDIIRPRTAKSLEEQQERTRKKAEVMTPVWLCCQMCNYLDEDWFGRKDVFNVLHEDHSWDVVEEKIEFPKAKKKGWQKYVDSRRLEITCGEGPYIVSRYDTATGKLIAPPKRRIGMLDRKLRIVNENTDNYDDWLKWTIRAFESSYGFEYQGDNLLIARINLLLTFCEYYAERWEKDPDIRTLRKLARKISWNIWQMDGLKDTVPIGKPGEEYHQMSLFEIGMEGSDAGTDSEDVAPYCRIRNWRGNKTIVYHSMEGN